MSANISTIYNSTILYTLHSPCLASSHFISSYFISIRFVCLSVFSPCLLLLFSFFYSIFALSCYNFPSIWCCIYEQPQVAKKPEHFNLLIWYIPNLMSSTRSAHGRQHVLHLCLPNQLV